MTARWRRRTPFGNIAAVLSFTLISRAIGFLRELIIAAGFGFSHATDVFYQLAAAPTYLMTYICGPFATSYIAWTNRADAPDEQLCRALILKFLAIGTALLAAGMGLVTYGISTHGAATAFALPQVLMALSCIATGVVGFSATVANAQARFARAQSILFANNLAFVVLLGAGALVFRNAVLLALTTAFAAAALVACAYGYHAVMAGMPTPSIDPAQRAARSAHLHQSLRRQFLPMLGYASSETLGFLATQGLVLFLASSSGVGVASAGSLAQRIALTVNGLVINPLSGMAMVRLSKLPEGAQRTYLVRVATLTLAGLAGVAIVLTVAAQFTARFGHSANGVLLASLIPSYALWLVAQGTNTMLSRLSFARGAVRLYTGATLVGYGLANFARYAVWHSRGFGAAIAAGSAVELLAALVVLVCLARQRAATGPVLAAVAAP
jgi:peptidoglycan biosynthesis protein MviN/MurJ (putative lipid II flippase)